MPLADYSPTQAHRRAGSAWVLGVALARHSMASPRRRSSAGLGERAAKDRTPFRPSPLWGMGGRARVAVSRLFANVGAERRGAPRRWSLPWPATRRRRPLAPPA